MQPTLTRDQVRRIDELAVSRFKMPSILLMENAGRNAAAIIDRGFGPAGTAVIVCGPGNNGGDGLVIARHLHNADWRVRVVLTAPPARFTPDAATNFSIVETMTIECVKAFDSAARHVALAEVPKNGILIDALLGTGFSGVLRPDAVELIEGMNAARRRRVVAVDVPSGLDCDTGQPCPVAVHADLTITFVAAKPGLIRPESAEWVGRLEVADIGVAREIVEGAARKD